MKHAIDWVLVVALVFVVLGYLCLLVYSAKHSVDATPKQDMFMCDTHGPLPRGAVMKLFDQEMDFEVDGVQKRGPIEYCPLCFEQKIKTARERK